MDPQDEKDQNIQDEQVVSTDEPSTNNNGADELLAVEHAIKTRIIQVEKLRQDLKEQKEMLKSLLENDPDYLEKEKTAKAANKDKTGAKQRVLSTPEGRTLNQKVKDLSVEAKDLQEGLSYYLSQYQRLTGATQFEGEDGELREIVYVAKLVRKTNLNK